MNFQNLDDAITYLNKFQFHGFRLGLERIEAVLDHLGNPHLSYPCIHVAGSNGKGSVCSALSSILKENGLRVGLYTSPHLVKLNERFRINFNPIGDNILKRLIGKIANLVEKGFELSYFEFTTALAFLFFVEQGVDLAIIETGLGGRLDATNVIRPKLCIITNISLEHKTYLGDTIEKIAFEKAGIIKDGVPVVVGQLGQPEKSVIEQVARKKCAKIIRFDEDFQIKDIDLNNQSFSYKGEKVNLQGIRFGLFGEHQMQNAAVAIAGCEQLMSQGIFIGKDTIKKGLKNAFWPGRSEILWGKFPVFLEGAHNDAGLLVLSSQLQFVDKLLQPKKKVLLWACSNEGDDKDPGAMLKKIQGLFDKVIVTEPQGPRKPVTIDQWKGIKLNFDVEYYADFKKALKLCENGLVSANDLLVVAGSLYLIGPCRYYLLKGSWRKRSLEELWQRKR